MKYKVSQVSYSIKKMLQQYAGNEMWVYGELNGYNRYRSKNSHVYPSICERDEAGAITTKLSLCIFRNSHKKILDDIRESDNPFTLEDGLEVCFKLKLDYYVPSGNLSGIVAAIDPTHTLEEAKRRRLEILKLLTKDEIINNNKELDIPVVITKIGLITAEKSAAESDFLDELTRSKYGFKVVVCHATMQGKDTERTVISAFLRLLREKVEIICITRGGGDVTDLQWFDNEKIARTILAHDIPVFSGIGHEIDRCVLDEIAREFYKTPTALAQSLVLRIQGFLLDFHTWIKRSQEYTYRKWHNDRTELKSYFAAIKSNSRNLVDSTRQDLALESKKLKNIWADFNTQFLLNLRGLLSMLKENFKEKLLRNKFSIDANVSRLRRVLRVVPAEVEKLKDDCKGMRLGVPKLISYEPLLRLYNSFTYLCKIGRDKHKNSVEKFSIQMKEADPLRQLKRGYSITRRADGTILDGMLKKNDMIITDTYFKKIMSKVTEVSDGGN